jgi:hypothetical protein
MFGGLSMNVRALVVLVMMVGSVAAADGEYPSVKAQRFLEELKPGCLQNAFYVSVLQNLTEAIDDPSKVNGLRQLYEKLLGKADYSLQAKLFLAALALFEASCTSGVCTPAGGSPSSKSPFRW